MVRPFYQCTLVAATVAYFSQVVRLTSESHISVCTPGSNRIRSAWLVGCGGRPCDSVHRPPESTPISSRFPTQFSWHVLTESGYILSVSTASPRVTFCMARYATLTRPALPFMLEFCRRRDPARLYLPQFPYRSLAFQTRFVTGLVGCLGVCPAGSRPVLVC